MIKPKRSNHEQTKTHAECETNKFEPRLNKTNNGDTTYSFLPKYKTRNLGGKWKLSKFKSHSKVKHPTFQQIVHVSIYVDAPDGRRVSLFQNFSFRMLTWSSCRYVVSVLFATLSKLVLRLQMFDVYVLERIFRLSIFKPGRVRCWFVVLLCVVCLRFMLLFCTNNFENIFVATKLYFIKVTSGQGQPGGFGAIFDFRDFQKGPFGQTFRLEMSILN